MRARPTRCRESGRHAVVQPVGRRRHPLDPPDILHVHDWFGTEGAAAGARVTGRLLVMTIHSTEYDRSLGHPWTEILDREKIGLAAADRVIAVSEHLKQQLIDRYGVDAAKVRVIYNAVRPTGRLATLVGSQAIVLYLGRLAAMKGVDTFLRAAARAAPSAPGCVFVVAGSGPSTLDCSRSPPIWGSATGCCFWDR